MSGADALRGRAVLLDTNLVVLWCVGRAGAERVKSFKHTQAFDPDDVPLLDRTLASARTIATLAYVVAETSNLLGQGDSAARRLRELARFAGRSSEHVVAVADAAAHPLFRPLGAADAAILTLLRRAPELTLLTVDATLDDVAGRAGMNSVNFNHIREAERHDFH